MVTYSIKNWDKIFENNRTRELKKLDWVPVPNKQDGDGYSDLLTRENGPALFGAWNAILQLASKCDPRGTLLRDSGTPHNSLTISRMSRFPEDIIKSALKILVEIGWLECKEFKDNNLQQIPHEPAEIPHEPAEKCLRREGKGMEGNGKEENGKEEKRGLSKNLNNIDSKVYSKGLESELEALGVATEPEGRSPEGEGRLQINQRPREDSDGGAFEERDDITETTSHPNGSSPTPPIPLAPPPAENQAKFADKSGKCENEVLTATQEPRQTNGEGSKTEDNKKHEETHGKKIIVPLTGLRSCCLETDIDPALLYIIDTLDTDEQWQLMLDHYPKTDSPIKGKPEFCKIIKEGKIKFSYIWKGVDITKKYWRKVVGTDDERFIILLSTFIIDMKFKPIFYPPKNKVEGRNPNRKPRGKN